MQNRAIAITGGIGSGKSAVLAILARLGACTLSADAINKELLTTPSYVEGLAELFPSCVVAGVVNKALLRELIFNDTHALKKLNEYAHPRIIKEIQERINALQCDVFVEMPLLVESNATTMFDSVWVVVSNTALEKAAQRDSLSFATTEKVAHCQAQDEDRIAIADVIIDNNGTLEELEANVKQTYYDFINER